MSYVQFIKLIKRGDCRKCTLKNKEKIYCTCGKSYIEGNYPCGTKFENERECKYQCSIIRECGHKANHQCHEKGINCTECTEIVDKMCNGGHTTIKNVLCSVKEVSCGNQCNKMLKCLMHKCTRNCHGGECEGENDKCMKLCGKILKCGHLCKKNCHTNDEGK
jgi:transcriptional repressor NF-X1